MSLQWPSLLLDNGIRNQGFVLDVLIYIGVLLFLGSQLSEQGNTYVCTRGSGDFTWTWIFSVFHVDSIFGQKFSSYLQGSCGNSGTLAPRNRVRVSLPEFPTNSHHVSMGPSRSRANSETDHCSRME